MTDKEFIAYLVEMMSEQQYPCDICEMGWRNEVCTQVDRIVCIKCMRKWAESKEKERK